MHPRAFTTAPEQKESVCSPVVLRFAQHSPHFTRAQLLIHVRFS